MKTSVINRLLAGLILILASLQLVASGPENGRLTGQLLDGETREPIPYANVILLRADNHAFVRSVATGADGSFKFNNVPLGDYTLRTTVLGYQTVKPFFALNMLQGKVAMGPIVMQPLKGLAVRPVTAKKVASLKCQPAVTVASAGTLPVNALAVR